ncbi:MAG: acetate--CoA ligase, partial [Aquificae bacterium]|nr:acetate--CoA ligase [Aquificota bacterium]
MPEKKDEVLLKVNEVYYPPKRVLEKALITAEEFDRMYRRSIEDPEGFWGEQAEKELHWFKKWDKV